MKVALDIDNVLAAIIEAARTTLAEDLGVHRDDVVAMDRYHQPFRWSDRQGGADIEVAHSFWDQDRVLSRCPVLPGAVEAVGRLAGAGALAGYVTRRPPRTRPTTVAWLIAAPFPGAPLAFVGTEDPETTYATCKSIACRRMGATHLVDDHASEFASARAAGIEVVVVDFPVGRAMRTEAMRPHPDAVLVPDVGAAIDHLLGTRRAAA